MWEAIKPKPNRLPGNAENFSIKSQEEQDFVMFGIEDSLKEIVDVIDSGLHPILVGESGIGKSLRAKALAAAFRKGLLFSHHKNKALHRYNTADLLNYQASFLGGGNDILYKISNAMGRHANEIILILDEIHMACVENGELANQLKTALEKGGFLKCVIGITTKEEYEKYFTGQTAFSNRFRKVEIKEITKKDTIGILSYKILGAQDPLILEPGALEHLYDVSKSIKAPQPKSSLTLLDKCISLTKKKLHSPLESEIAKIKSQIAGLKAISLVDENQQLTDLESLNKDLSEAESKLKLEKVEIEKLYKKKKLFDTLTKVRYQTIISLNKDMTNQNVKSKFLLLTFFREILLKYIKQKAEKLKVDLIINKALIDRALTL